MKHSKILALHYLTVWGNMLEQASLERNPARYLLDHNAREPLFYLEAMARVLATKADSKDWGKIRVRFKTIEDALGQMDFYAGLQKDIQDLKVIPDVVRVELKSHYDAATAGLNALLKSENWLGENPLRIHKIQKKFVQMQWHNDKQVSKTLYKVYTKAIDELQIRLNQPFEDMEADVHELRRDVRWLSIYAHAFKGFVGLQKDDAASDVWAKYCSPEVLQSPFSDLPQVDGIEDVVFLSQNHFYALSWLIASLGLLKDQGLRLLTISSIWSELMDKPHTEIIPKVWAALGANQATESEIMHAARLICNVCMQDGVIEHLLVKVKK